MKKTRSKSKPNQETYYAHVGRYPALGCSGSAAWIRFAFIVALMTFVACAAFLSQSIPKRSQREAFFIRSPLRYFITAC